ncbi:DUF4381 domain-containing protein [Alteromonas sp. ASW11-130]|uniref:DUF4381 domain-containing protein n=1 Tax=Alteromonas sp. ASW11-130 TaxID=3015775 RepID=UPI002241AA86|nr:DUF4381 domain-containing protein [Alteromonas sp. ASW11-130]MCW8093049.1 DUF4381 domain-containing protein [Alteromonas sp. ASW11-130]
MQAQTLSNPLENLQDIHVPESVSAWPLAWGWWIVIGITILGLIVAAVWFYKRYQFSCAKRQAIKEIYTLQANQADWAQKQNAILKRTASYYFDKHTVASLYGQRWQQFLVGCLAKRKKGQITQEINQLQKALYQPQPPSTDQFESCQKACLYWLKHARFAKKTPTVEVEASNA